MEALLKLIKPLIQKATTVKVKRSSKPLSVTASKFGGTPYIENGETWPKCQECSMPLSFICQMDLRKINHPGCDKVPFFTLFYCWPCFPWDDDKGDWLVRTYLDPQVKKAVKIETEKRIPRTKECKMTFQSSLTLPDWDGVARHSKAAQKLCVQLNKESPWETYDQARIKLGVPSTITTRIGGYPSWIQNDGTPKKHLFLAQIDSEDDADIMWGDSGLIYLFVSTGTKPTITMTLQCC